MPTSVANRLRLLIPAIETLSSRRLASEPFRPNGNFAILTHTKFILLVNKEIRIIHQLVALINSYNGKKSRKELIETENIIYMTTVT